ncbi:hypothetical protein EPJ69_11800 [Brachyspira aalborgi]|uniref:Sulfatase N-terminal domain-containing protein n=1 Tax=Brachyspira aalborgi TaxID=29522 RepID=A0A5C8DXF7_9SPIR|nr:hypothetical protein EPJ69_11800 [Brachyspira aalborgi]
MPYEISTNGGYNLKEKHNQALLTIPLALEKYNYKSTMLNIPYANFQLYNYLNIYTNIKAYDNNTIYEYSINKYLNVQTNDYANNNSFNKKIMRFSIFRMLPINLRYDFYDDKGWFLNSLNINSSIFTYAMLNYTKYFININENGNYYNVIHNDITHEPFYFTSDFLPHLKLNKVNDADIIVYKDDNSVRHFYANVASMNILTNFINFLKRNYIYDNTKIIILSDHGGRLNTTLFADTNINFINGYNALLMYKDFNSKGEIKIDTNFMTIADTPYLATKHISNIKNPFNNKLITNDYKTNGAYMIDLSSSPKVEDQFSNAYNFKEYYYVKDNIFDINNWKKFQINWKTKENKEIELN